MSKIGFFILSATQDLFQLETKLLVNYYKNVIEFYNIDVDLYSFVGDETIEKTYEKDGVIYCKCKDGDLCQKHKELFNYILENKGYDYFLSTNTSTIVNLKEIYDSVPNFDKNCYYGVFGFLTQVKKIDTKFFYPNGNFKLFHIDILRKLYSEFDKLQDMLEETAVPENMPVGWFGVPDDILIGLFLHLNKIEIRILSKFIRIFHFWNYSQQNTLIPIDKASVIQYKMPMNTKDRLLLETQFLNFLINQLQHKQLNNIK